MDATAPRPEPADAAAAKRAAADRTERQLRVLDALSAFGLELAEALAAETRAGKLTTSEATSVFDRLSRSVRRTVALQLRILDDIEKTPAERAAERAVELARREAAAALAMGRAAAGRAVDKADGPKTDRENLAERPERLNDPDVDDRDTSDWDASDWDADDDLDGKTYGEILAGVGKDFGIEPDLGAFTAEELARIYVRPRQPRAELARRVAALTSRAGGFARRLRTSGGRPRAMTAAPLPAQNPPAQRPPPQRPAPQRPPTAAGRTGPP